MKLAIFGVGYVGLVSGCCFAEMGIDVVCVDVNRGRIDNLSQGIIPIYEPGLEELLRDNREAGRLHFTCDATEALEGADAAFICVGTPMAVDGRADLRYIESVARSIGKYATGSLVVVTKSTVPVGTSQEVKRWLAEGVKENPHDVYFSVASNPEFLKEGAAIDDFMRPDRIIIGVEDEHSEGILRDIYAGFIRNGMRIYTMDIPSAEMCKYASNCMLATKISFINEMANICEHVGADVRQVRMGMGADSRIGYQFLHPGPGYGGSCFPKDVRALAEMSQRYGYNPKMLQAVEQINEEQKVLMARKIFRYIDLYDLDPAQITVAIWGLAFKPNTDDVREAPSLAIIRELTERGIRVRAHDPKAVISAQEALRDCVEFIEYCDHPYEASEGADFLCVVTEWRPYRRPDFTRLAQQLKCRVIFDARNLYNDQQLAERGLSLVPVGHIPMQTLPLSV